MAVERVASLSGARAQKRFSDRIRFQRQEWFLLSRFVSDSAWWSWQWPIRTDCDCCVAGDCVFVMAMVRFDSTTKRDRTCQLEDEIRHLCSVNVHHGSCFKSWTCWLSKQEFFTLWEKDLSRNAKAKKNLLGGSSSRLAQVFLFCVDFRDALVLGERSS